MTEPIRLTLLSHGTGCGCKIAPAFLEEILRDSASDRAANPALLVGNEHRDDAAAWLLDERTVLLSTTDFFMPIVDDPRDFGHIAAANALSDIYAMGGRPIFALGILGFPTEALPVEVARDILAGAREVCREAGIPLAGGHSIDNPEPVFGLVVNGLVERNCLKTNASARPGDRLYLTKPLGVGLLTTVAKMGLLPAADLAPAVAQMKQLNKIGSALGQVPSVNALTDVTGFGLLGHLSEMCRASGVQARVFWENVPILGKTADFLHEFLLPKGAKNNLVAFGENLDPRATDHQRWLLADPQTSGGLLIAVAAEGCETVEKLLGGAGLWAACVGELVEAGGERLVALRS